MTKKIAISILALMMIMMFGVWIPGPQAAFPNAVDYEANGQLKVRHKVQGSSLFVECVIPGVSFKANPNVKIKLYVNGNEYAEYDTAAFVVKNLKPGIQEIKVEIIKPDNQSKNYEQFSVIIS